MGIMGMGKGFLGGRAGAIKVIFTAAEPSRGVKKR